MHFDDRLATVLRLRADGQAVQRIQFRQLLDLLGTSPAEARGEMLDTAYVRLAELAGAIPAAGRAAMVGDPGLRLRSPRLVAALAGREPQVAARVLHRAELSDEQWLDLIPALPPAARVHLRGRQGLSLAVTNLLARLGVHDRGLPPIVEAAATPVETPVAPPPPTDAATEADAIPAPDPDVLAPQPEPAGIGAIVRRIEAYRKAKQVVVEHAPIGDSPRLPLGEEHVLHVPGEARAFDFATNAEGRIAWADPGVAAMVIGLRLGGEQAHGPAELTAALRRHQPLQGCAITLAGAPAIAGDWRIDAAPWFDPLGGHYLGHRGRMRRPAAGAASDAPLAAATPTVRDSEADRIRQMLHELRTPVNAIQVGAEIIQQQLYGPTPHEYRALAAGIAGDAARMLSAFEELERLARLGSGAMELDAGETDLVAVVGSTVAQLADHTRQRGSGFALKIESQPLAVGLARIEVERVIWRLLATLAGTSAPGEMLKARLKLRHGMVRLDLQLPASLAAREGDELFRASAGAIPQVIAAGVFGVGFALRLARAEAEAAGGKLDRKDERLRLTLPGLTRGNADHTERQRAAD
jgi:two-component system, OmpR family, sensor kinase